MPATPAAAHNKTAGASIGPSAESDSHEFIRLHITPFTPALLKVYIAPSVLPLAKNISYHHVETFPEKGFGYVELPLMEAQKIKKKLNGSTLKGTKVRIEDAKPEKRKAGEDSKLEENDKVRPSKRAKKERLKKEQGVLEGVELPADRKVKRGWTEPPAKNKKERKEKEKEKKAKRKESKYTKEPEVLFKAKLTPVAATELGRKEKSKDKRKDKKKSKPSQEVIVHEFENNTKHPSFLKAAKVVSKKPAVEYINGQGWVDEDGNVVEAETGKARNRRVLELVDSEPVPSNTEIRSSATPSPKSSPGPSSVKKEQRENRREKVTSLASSSELESESDESSVLSSSSDEDSSGSEVETESAGVSSEAAKVHTPEIAVTPSSPEKKEIHPLEALYKRSKPSAGSNPSSTPAKSLAPINTSFSFFDNNNSNGMEVFGEPTDNAPVTPFTQRDLEWRGLRSAAPTPDTAAVGRRFSFPWRNGSQEADDDDDDEDVEAETQLTNNTKANASSVHLPGVVEEEEEGEEKEAQAGAQREDDDVEGDGEPESEFKKWFWENQGSLNRAWKKRRRDTLKAKRLSDNKRAVGGRRHG